MKEKIMTDAFFALPLMKQWHVAAFVAWLKDTQRCDRRTQVDWFLLDPISKSRYFLAGSWVLGCFVRAWVLSCVLAK